MSILVIAEHRQGRLRDVTREMVTAAKGLDGDVAVAVIHRDPASWFSQVTLEGVGEVVGVPVPTEEFDSDTYGSVLEALILERKPDVVLLGFTVDSAAYAPTVAARLGLGFASDVWALRRDDQGPTVTRSFYAGKVSGELDFPGASCVVLLLRADVWAPALEGGSPRFSEFRLPPPASRVRHLGFQEVPAGDVDISLASLILAIGRGIGERDNIPQFERLAEKMGATLASSRPLVDAGWMPGSRLVGQSGRTVKPTVYLAFGISGAVQHRAGMKSSGMVIAVNADPDAAIFSVAHYGAVADLFEVAEELDKLF